MRIIRVVSQHIGNKTANFALCMPQQKRQVIPRIFLTASQCREFGIQLFAVGIPVAENPLTSLYGSSSPISSETVI